MCSTASPLCTLAVLSTVLIAQPLPVQGLLFSSFLPAHQSLCWEIRLSLQPGIKAWKLSYEKSRSRALGWSAGMLPLLPRCRGRLLLLMPFCPWGITSWTLLYFPPTHTHTPTLHTPAHLTGCERSLKAGSVWGALAGIQISFLKTETVEYVGQELS